MKKFNLVIAALLLISVSAFAVDVVPTATVSGEASVTFTYDLEDSVFDIENDAEAAFSISFVEETSVEGGEGDVVGHIEISGIAASISSDNLVSSHQTDDAGGSYIDKDDDGTADEADDDVYSILYDVIAVPDVSAMIYLMGPSLYLDITNLGAETDFAAAPDFNDDYGLDGMEGVNDVAEDADPAGSVSLVYTSDAFNATLTVGDDTTGANGADFFAGFGLTAVEGLTLDTGVSYDESGTVGYGVAASFVVSDGLLTIGAGFDGNDSSDMQIEGTLGVDVGATVDVTFGTDTEVSDLIVSASTGTLVEVITLTATLELADFTDLGLLVELTSDLGVLTPYATFAYYDPTIGLTVGTGIAVIDNVALDLNYSTDDLDNDNGAVEFSASIAY